MSESSDPDLPERKKLLIVEDHPLFRSMLAQMICQQSDMTVCGETDNIRDAMRMVENTDPHAAIIDLTLKGSSGLELVKTLKTRTVPLPVLVLSMQPENLYAERVLRAGARGFISKSETPSEVILAIRKVLDGGIYVSESINHMLLQRLSNPSAVKRTSELDLLSDREIEVFQLFGQGLNSREISARISLGVSSVESYRSRIREKLVIRNSAELYQRAARWVAEQGL